MLLSSVCVCISECVKHFPRSGAKSHYMPSQYLRVRLHSCSESPIIPEIIPHNRRTPSMQFFVATFCRHSTANHAKGKASEQYHIVYFCLYLCTVIFSCLIVFSASC